MGKASRRKRVARPKGELVAALQRQLRFLERSAEEFDRGDESEAVRLAGALRIILYDSGVSTSLLTALKLKRQTKFLDTGGEMVENEEYPDGTGCSRVRLDGSLLTYTEYGPGGMKVGPLLGSHRPDVERWFWFHAWWTRPVLSLQPGQMTEEGMVLGPGASRGDLVLWLANEDGGAHVDEGLSPMHSELTRTYRGRVPINDQRAGTPVYAAVRQVAYEVLETMATNGVLASVPDLRATGSEGS